MVSDEQNYLTRKLFIVENYNSLLDFFFKKMWCLTEKRIDLLIVAMWLKDSCFGGFTLGDSVRLFSGC